MLRCTVPVSGGTLIASGDIPKKDKTSPNARASIRVGTSIAGAVGDNEYLLFFGGSEVGTANTTGQKYIWEAKDINDRIRLGPNEAVIFFNDVASDADNFWALEIAWTEEQEE
jgi:hypothetical protein